MPTRYPDFVVIAEALAVRRGIRTIFSHVGFRLEGGKAVTLLGPNGVGKTTLLRCLAGFIRPVAGTARIAVSGETPDAHALNDQTLAELCHFIGHQNGLKRTFTVAENLMFWQEFLAPAPGGLSRDRPIGDALERLNLIELADIPTAYLSAGQKRRSALARLIVADRPIWLLDEPTVSLDAASTRLLEELVAEHTHRGGLVLAATHLPLGATFGQSVTLGAPLPASAEELSL